MKKNLLFLLPFLFVLCACIGANDRKSKPENLVKDQKMKTLHDFTVQSIDGKEFSLAQLKGKKVLVVNVASACGYTPQYADLQKLSEKYASKLVVIGFPANNFGGQEPGSNDEIAQFCKKNYGVSFPMFEKISVKGNDMHPLYKWLSSKSENGWNDQAPTWNFCKYLVSENGELLKYFGSNVKPMDEELLKAIN